MVHSHEDLVWHFTRCTNPSEPAEIVEEEINHSASFNVNADFEIPHRVEDRYL